MTDSFFAFTTTPASRPLIVTPARPTASTLLPTGTLTFSQDTKETGATGTETSTTITSQPPPPAKANETNTGSPNNAGAIIGGVVGCLALICVSSVSVVWLRRRYRRKDTSKAPSVNDVAPENNSAPVDGETEIKLGYFGVDWRPQELEHSVPVRELGGVVSPVELPAGTPRLGR